MVTRMKADERAEEAKDLSRPVSPIADNESLTGHDDLPTYEGSQAGSVAGGRTHSEKSAAMNAPRMPAQSSLSSGAQYAQSSSGQSRKQQQLPDYEDQQFQQPISPVRSYPSQQRQQPAPVRPVQNLQPTASSPFQFPVNAPPPDYDEIEDINRPLAIPQVSPSGSAAFVAAYPSVLLSFGIPRDSWRSFLQTLSAFVSADISKQALHHATDVANSIGENMAKRFVKPTMKQVDYIEKSARNLNPFGVVRGTVRLTVGTAFRVVGSLLPVHRAIWQKPSTPRARAEVYLATANNEWFHKRGLHAWLLDTRELADLVGLEQNDLLEAASFNQSPNADVQLEALRDVLGDLEVDAVPKPELGPTTPSGFPQTPVPHDAKQKLELGEKTLWLVLSQEGTFQANGEHIVKGNTHSSRR